MCKNPIRQFMAWNGIGRYQYGTWRMFAQHDILQHQAPFLAKGKYANSYIEYIPGFGKGI